MPDPQRPVVALSSSGATLPCAAAARAACEAAGYEVAVFPADGVGGRALERFLRDGRAVGVLDLSPSELADELFGGGQGAGPDRLTAAALAGVPQVIAPGGLDRVTFDTTFARTTPEQNDRLGQEIAQKACAARGPTAILLPLRGVSSHDIDGGISWWPEADAALFQSLRNWVYGVELIELDLHVNDPAFGAACAETLLRLLRVTRL